MNNYRVLILLYVNIGKEGGKEGNKRELKY